LHTAPLLDSPKGRLDPTSTAGHNRDQIIKMGPFPTVHPRLLIVSERRRKRRSSATPSADALRRTYAEAKVREGQQQQQQQQGATAGTQPG
jgi:hypothetical protein